MKIIFDKLKHVWNAFKLNNEDYFHKDLGFSSSVSPIISNYSRGFTQSIIFAVCNRIAMDVAAYDIQHVRIDLETKRYVETIKSNLNNCLTLEANLDQTGRTFIQDIVMSMFDEGYVAVIPIDTDINPNITNSYEINSLRTGRIIEWYPKHIKVDVYNDRTGYHEELILSKSIVAIIENPLYAVMNEPNSTMKRLMHKLVLLDAIDNQSGSGKLDLIIQLPYVIKSELKQKQANERRKAIEDQLAGSKYGIAYIDGTEHITQLNRPSENNLMSQITYLTNMLYSQLGISEAVFNGTADEKAMLNYYDRTIEPIATAIIDEMKRKFLTKTARTQGQTIMGFRDVFRLIPANEIAEIADSLTRNEILSSNEVRSILGMRPSNNPSADELRNKNMPISESNSTDLTTNTDQNSIDPGISVEQVQQIIDDMSQEYEKTITDILNEVQKNIDESLLDGIEEVADVGS